MRGGYGIYYARYPGRDGELAVHDQQSLSAVAHAADLAGCRRLAVAPVFPNLLPSPAGTPGAATVGFAAPDLRTPYSEQADFAIQRALDAKTSSRSAISGAAPRACSRCAT